MPTLNINGKRIKVDDSFLKLSPEQQNAAVEEIASNIPGEASPDAFRPESFEQHEAPPDNRSVFRRIDDGVRGVADMLSFGFADEIAAGADSALGSGSYDANLADQRKRDSEGGAERFAGQMAGAFMMPFSSAKTVAGAAMQGAGHGAAYGFGSGEGSTWDRMESAAIGAATGGTVGAGVRAGANALQTRAARKAIPSNDQLRAASQSAYDEAERAGVILNKTGMGRLMRNVVTDMTQHGFLPANEPGAAAVYRELSRIAKGNVTLKGLDTVRKMAGNAYIPGNASNNKLTGQIIERIDEMVESGDPAMFLTGNSTKAAGAMREARNLWGRARRSETLDDAVERADLRAASTGSGGNADNAVRQNVRRIVEKPRGFTNQERGAAERVVRGTVPQNALRLLGKLAPTGVVSGVLSGGAGYGLLGPAGLALPLLGQAAKTAADKMTTRNVSKLSEIIRSGGYSARDLARLARDNKIPLPAVKAIEAAERQYQGRLAQVSAMIGDRTNRSVSDARPPVIRQGGTPLEITVTKPGNIQR